MDNAAAAITLELAADLGKAHPKAGWEEATKLPVPPGNAIFQRTVMTIAKTDTNFLDALKAVGLTRDKVVDAFVVAAQASMLAPNATKKEQPNPAAQAVARMLAEQKSEEVEKKAKLKAVPCFQSAPKPPTALPAKPKAKATPAPLESQGALF